VGLSISNEDKAIVVSFMGSPFQFLVRRNGGGGHGVCRPGLSALAVPSAAY